MQKKFIKVRDLFSEDFFIRLKDFIFEESFEFFFNRRIKEIKTYAGYDESLWYPIEEDMKTSDIYPISFNDFLKMYDNVGACTSFVDKSLFCIKFLIKELFENPKSEFLNNENFSIKLNKNVILNQYDKVFDSNFLEIKLSYLDRYLGIFSNNEKSIDLCARNIIFFCLNYIQGYLENIVENILVDNNILINAYDSETKYNLSLNKKNRTKEKNSLIKNFINTSKEIRNSRFKLMSGKSKIEILGYFPRNYECLEKEIKRIKKEYDNHEYIKSQLRKIKKGCKCSFRSFYMLNSL